MGRRVLVLVAVLCLLVALLPALGGAAEPDRVAGPSRFATAVQIAQRSFPDGSGVVYLARADQFADALAAGTLTDGPTLLVPSCGDLPGEVVDEIARLDPDSVIALGGVQAVCDELLATAATGRNAERIAGVSRFDTAAAIAGRAFGDGAEVVYVANAADSPDAIAGGALVDGPILLVPSDGDPPPIVTQTLATLDPETVIALGGSQAVADTTLASAAGGRTTDRLSGASRFDTAAAIAGRAFPTDTGVATVYLARGDVFADAVASGSLTDGPVLLVGSCGPLPDAAVDYLTAAQADTVIALGGTQAVCDQVLTDAATIATGGTPPSPPPTEPPPTEPPPTEPDGVLTGTLYFHDFTNYESLAMGSLAEQDAPDVIYTEQPAFDYSTQLATREFVYVTRPAGEVRANVVIRTLALGQDETGGFVWQRPTPEGGVQFTNELATPELSPDGLYLLANVTYGDDENVWQVSDRYGNYVASVASSLMLSAAWTPDGDLLAAVAKPDGGTLLGKVTLDDLIDDQSFSVAPILPFPDGAATPFGFAFSADGTQIAYGQDGDLWVVAAAPNAEPQRLAFGAGAVPLIDFAFEPDGETIAVLFNYNFDTPEPSQRNESSLHLVPNHQGEAIEISSDDETSVRIGPDGETVKAYGHLTWSPEPEEPLPPAVAPPAEPPAPPLPAFDGVLTTSTPPEGAENFELEAVATDLSDLAAPSNPTTIVADGLEDGDKTKYGAFDFEPDLGIIAQTVGTGFPDQAEVVFRDLVSGAELDRLVWRLPVEGGTLEAGRVLGAALAPDGEHVFGVVSYFNNAYREGVYLEVADRSGLVVADYPGEVSDFTWTPSGDLLVTAPDPDVEGGTVLGVVARAGLLAGEGITDVLATYAPDEPFADDPVVSPDGSEIAYGFGRDIYVAPFGPELGEPRQLTRTDKPLYQPAYSPDGGQIAVQYELEPGDDFFAPERYVHIVDNNQEAPVPVFGIGPSRIPVGPDGGSLRAFGEMAWTAG